MKFLRKQKDEDFILEQPEENIIFNNSAEKPTPSHRLTPDEVLGIHDVHTTNEDGKSALDSLKQRIRQANTEAQTVAKQPSFKNTDPSKSLLEKCKPFITDDSGTDASNAAPLYKLESVAEILEGKTSDTITRLAEQYDITVDDLKRNKKKEQKKQQKEKIKSPTPTQDKEIIEINAFFENVQSSVPFAVSEVESTNLGEISTEEETATSATITFTPVTEKANEKPKMVVTSNTQSIDLTGEFSPIEDISSSTKPETVTLEKDEFEDFVPQEEIKTEVDVKKHIRKLSILKRRSFLTLSASVLLTLVLAFLKLPFMSSLILGKTQPMMIISASITAVIALLNIDVFAQLPKIFTKKSVADVPAALATVCVLAYSVVGILSGEIVLDMLLLLGITLSLRALSKFRKDSYTLSNLKQLASSGEKNALRLLDDPTVTFAIAKNSVEGDTLIAAPQKCNNVSDYMKYTTFGTFLNGKLPLISIISIILSVASGFAAAYYYGGAVHGLYAAAAIQCYTALPSLFFIVNFPLYSAAKKLNRRGAMIAGQMGASLIDMANALVLNSSDIFPSGTVTLHQMKVLSENSLDETILRAASLTESLNSPLAPIFKRIAGESNITAFPDSDTIKYEERMGISGWVDDKLLFIGNRTLMEAHGISVPDVELDYKILKSGFFPVYVASADTACALLVVQYTTNPDIANELRHLSKIGVTVLVNNTDPNINAEMICDYLGLYEDSVMIMTNAGYHMYKNTVTPRESISAPACFKHSNIMLARIINYANKIRRSNTLLTILYLISAIIGIIFFAYSSFTGGNTIISSSTVLLYSLICTAVTYLLYLIEKP